MQGCGDVELYLNPVLLESTNSSPLHVSGKGLLQRTTRLQMTWMRLVDNSLVHRQQGQPLYIPAVPHKGSAEPFVPTHQSEQNIANMSWPNSTQASFSLQTIP